MDASVRKMNASEKPSQRLKMEALRAYARHSEKPACATCGEDDPICLTLSHRTGFTQAERAEAARIHRPRLSGSTLRGWLKRQGWPHDVKIADVVVECLNCNVKRGGWGDGRPGQIGRAGRDR
jgi:hypothetical protein